jgi:hypothetical protein
VEKYSRRGGNQPIELVQFRVLRVDAAITPKGNFGQWNVIGCATIKQKGKLASYEAAQTIYLDKGEWYLDEVGLFLEIDGPLTRCEPAEGVDVSQLCRDVDNNR